MVGLDAQTGATDGEKAIIAHPPGEAGKETMMIWKFVVTNATTSCPAEHGRWDKVAEDRAELFQKFGMTYNEYASWRYEVACERVREADECPDEGYFRFHRGI